MSTGWSRWSNSRSPSASAGPGTASAIPAVMRSSASARTSRRATVAERRRRGRRVDPAPAIRARRGPPWPGGPPIIRSRALDRHVPVVGPRTLADDHRSRAGPGGAGRLTRPQRPPDRRPGSPAGALVGAHRRGRDDATVVDPGRERTIPIVSISGTNGKSTVTRLISHILLLAGRRVGTTTSDGVLVDERMVEPGDWTGPGGAQQILARRRPRRGRARDGARRDGPARRRLRIERRERADERVLGSPRPPGHPHAARTGRGQVDDLPDHQARRLGRPQRRRPATCRRSPAGSGRTSRTSRSNPTAAAGRSGATSSAVAGRTWSATAGWSRPTGRRTTDIAEVRRIPITIGGLARHNVANALAAAGGARGLGATIAQVARRPDRLPP